MAFTIVLAEQTSTANSASPSHTISSGPTSGNLLVAAVSARVAGTGSGNAITVSGWTTLHQGSGTSFAHQSWVGYKISDGTETAVTPTFQTSSSNTDTCISYMEVSGFTGTPTLDASSEDASNIDTNVTAQSTGSATATQANGIAVAFVSAFSSDLWATSQSWSNSFVSRADGGNNFNYPGVWSATLEYASTGAKTTTNTTTDTGDQAYGAIALFYDPSAGATTALTGTVTGSITETDVVNGGKTIILTLTGDTWAAAGTGPIGSTADTQAIIDGIDSAQAEATGWDAVVKAGLTPATDVVRTSSTVCTITLPAFATYDITAQETITATIPAAALVTSSSPVVASPTFTVDTEVADTITLTDITDDRIFQRDTATGNKSVTITGTYTGTPTAIQARIVEDGTSTEVVTWTTIDASPSAGTFSGAITVPEGGWYNVQVRYSNDTGITDEGTNGWGIGILIGCIGQSNIQNWFTDGSGQTPNALLRKYDPSGWAVLGAASNGATAFGNRIITNLTSAVPVGLVDYAVSGAALRSEADGGSGYWLDTSASSIYDDFKVAVTALGGELEFVIYGQGERDALSAVVTEAEYLATTGGLQDFIANQIRTDITNASDQTNLPFIIGLLGRGTAGVDAHFQAIRNAQEYVATNVADCYRFMSTDLALVDTIHLTPASYTTHGQRGAQVVLELLGEETYSRGPQIVNWRTVSSTQTDVTIAHDGGTDFTPVSAITGFEVLDDGTPVTISAAVNQSATVVRLTHTAITGVRTARYLYGANPTVTSPVLDNSALTLPLEGEDLISQYKYLSLTLVDRNSTAQTGLTGLDYAFFEQPLPQNFVSPVVKGSTETTDGSGVIEIDVSASALNPGQTGFLIVSDTDGDAAQSPSSKAFAAPVVVQ